MRAVILWTALIACVGTIIWFAVGIDWAPANEAQPTVAPEGAARVDPTMTASLKKRTLNSIPDGGKNRSKANVGSDLIDEFRSRVVRRSWLPMETRWLDSKDDQIARILEHFFRTRNTSGGWVAAGIVKWPKLEIQTRNEAITLLSMSIIGMPPGYWSFGFEDEDRFYISDSYRPVLSPKNREELSRMPDGLYTIEKATGELRYWRVPGLPTGAR
jgi:hypothetical protein